MQYNLRTTKVKGVVLLKNILRTIDIYRKQRGWTEYELAERSGLPQSTISSWYRKDIVPSIFSLEKICLAFGITMSQLFCEGNEPVCLTDSQKTLLEHWTKLNEEQREALLLFLSRI